MICSPLVGIVLSSELFELFGPVADLEEVDLLIKETLNLLFCDRWHIDLILRVALC